MEIFFEVVHKQNLLTLVELYLVLKNYEEKKTY